MIQISNLSKGYAHQDILKNISFTIHKGEKIGLVGRNGHGKTTLFRMITGMEKPDQGTILFPKEYTISYLKQEMTFTHPTILEEVLSALPDSEQHENWKAEKILFGLDFTENMIYDSPQILSGGWMNRINLAKVLISDADLLLLDEPTNHLDIITIDWLTKFLQSWRKELILITHDRFFMDAIVTHTMAIHRKQIKKISGTSEKIYEQIAQAETIHEKTRVNDEKEKARVEVFIRKFRAKARLAGMVQSRIKSLDKKHNKEKLEHISDLDFQFHFKPFDVKTMMTVENISFGYDPNVLLIDDLSFHISKGDKIAIIGKNGKGKSTLLKILCKTLNPTHGSLKPHPKMTAGYYGQVAEQELNPLLSVEEEIASALSGSQYGLARTIAGAMMFEGPLALKKCGILSGGEKARVLLGKLIATPTHCLFLDEPSNHLDMQSIDSLIEALDLFEGAMVFVTHNTMILHALATKLVVFDGDHPYLFLGTYQEFLEDKGFSTEKTSKNPNSNTLKKDRKKMKQQLIEKKSLLKPLQSIIKSLEEEITDLENQEKDLQKKLIEASSQNDGQTIVSISKTLTEITKKTNDLFSSLDQRHQELNNLTQDIENL